jgi:hypothetical protein
VTEQGGCHCFGKVVAVAVYQMIRELTNRISVDFFSSWYLDISVPKVCFTWLCIHHAIQLKAVGCPIQRSTAQRLFAPPRSLSRRITSFIACIRQGIHQTPLIYLHKFIITMSYIELNLHLSFLSTHTNFKVIYTSKSIHNFKHQPTLRCKESY